jgi:hypothetical protein
MCNDYMISLIIRSYRPLAPPARQAWAHLALRRTTQRLLRTAWLPGPLKALLTRPLRSAAEVGCLKPLGTALPGRRSGFSTV